MYWIETIDSLNFIDYQEFGKVFPHQYFFQCCKDPGIAAVGARMFGRAVGLAMAVRRNNRWIGIGVYVFSCYRRMGIGMALLEKLVYDLAGRGKTGLVFAFSPEIHYFNELAGLFRKAGFELSESHIRNYRTSCENLSNIPRVQKYALHEMLDRPSVIVGEWEIFRWSELQEKELKFLAEEEGISYGVDVSPMQVQGYIDNYVSLGVRDSHGLAGWLVVAAPSGCPDELYYKGLFLRRGPGNLMLVPRMMATSCLLQKRIGIPYIAGKVFADNAIMTGFIDRYLAADEYELKILFYARM